MKRLARDLGFGIWVLGFVLLAVLPSFGQAVNWPTETPPAPLPARQVNFPPYEIRTLSNGMQVVIVLHHEQPVVTIRLLVRAGAAQDPEGKGGVAALTAHLLDQGTTTRNAQQIASQIDLVGGALGTGSSSDLSFANVMVMKDSFAFGMNLLADVVHNPAFSPEEIERQKEQTISSLQVNGDDPDYVASTVFDRLVYGFHPYGLPGSGTPDTLARITRADLQAFHRRYFVPNNMILAIVGDVTSGEAWQTADKVFGAWARGDVPATRNSEPPPPTRRLVIVDKPDAVQTEIRIGQLAIPRKHPDFLAWDLAVKILGGEGANRLHRVLRSERGLTYGASAQTEALKDAGDFVAETDTRTETTGEALRLAVEEFARLQRQRVFARELQDAQAYLAGSFPITIETPNDIATQVLNAVFYELPLTDIPTFRERVLAITPDDIQRVAKEYIKPDRLAIVLVGNAKGFLPQLRGVGFTDYEVIPLDQLDLMSATLKKESPRASLGAFGTIGSAGTFGSVAAYTRTQVNPGANGPNVSTGANDPNARSAMTLLRRVVDAKGGLTALQAVKTVIAEADTALQMPQGTLTSSTKTYVAYPDRFRVDARVPVPPNAVPPGQTAPPAVEVVQIYNAGTAWVKDPSGVHDAPPAMRDDFAASVRRDTIPVLIGGMTGQYSVRQLADDTSAAGTPLKVLEFSGRQLDPIRFYISTDGLIAKQAFSAPGPDGRPLQVEEIFSDYRLVSGVRVPFQAQLRRDGQPVMTRTLKNVTINASLAPSLFARPE
jgi:zinc protease